MGKVLFNKKEGIVKLGRKIREKILEEFKDWKTGLKAYSVAYALSTLIRIALYKMNLYTDINRLTSFDIHHRYFPAMLGINLIGAPFLASYGLEFARGIFDKTLKRMERIKASILSMISLTAVIVTLIISPNPITNKIWEKDGRPLKSKIFIYGTHGIEGSGRFSNGNGKPVDFHDIEELFKAILTSKVKTLIIKSCYPMVKIKKIIETLREEQTLKILYEIVKRNGAYQVEIKFEKSKDPDFLVSLLSHLGINSGSQSFINLIDGLPYRVEDHLNHEPIFPLLSFYNIKMEAKINGNYLEIELFFNPPLEAYTRSGEKVIIRKISISALIYHLPNSNEKTVVVDAMTIN